jgi:hypothetical protein
VYFGKTAQWYSMVQLTNFSGYDRDSGKYLPGFMSHSDTPSNNFETIHQLEETLNITEQRTTNLSIPAQLILGWLQVNRPEQTVKYKGSDRDQSFINIAGKHGYTTQDVMVNSLFAELLITKNIDIDEVEGVILVL